MKCSITFHLAILGIFLTSVAFVTAVDKIKLTRSVFMVADTNKDGAIDMDEVVAVWDKLGPKEKPTTEVKIDRPFIQENFDKFDTDHNKKIDLKEFRALLTDKVTKMLEDANTSGKPLPF